MEGKSSYFILLVIVAFLSITLAFLAIGFFFFGNSSSGAQKEVVVVSQSVPTESDLTLRTICESKNFNLKKTSDKQIAVISISCSMKHYKVRDKDKLKEADVTAKIDFYSKEIESAIGTYFQGMTLEDVSQLDAKKKASTELTKKFNEIMSEGNSKAEPIVYDVIFDYWFFQ